MSAAHDRLAQTMDALSSIGARLRLSLDDDAAFFPVAEGGIPVAGKDDLRAYDAFLQRFQQAADHILRKLFPRLLAAANESPDELILREALEQLLRFRLIDNIETWLAVLQLRNRLTHDYALSPEEWAQDLNTAWDMAPLLLEQIARARAFADRHSLLTRD